MPSDQAIEKSSLLLKLGAAVERVPPAPIVDPMHFVNRARNLAAEHTADPNRPGRGYFADQFENQANWQAHYDGTGPEIFRQSGGQIDAFVAGAGTGGTIAGVARYLKPRLPDVKIVLADPQGSGLFNRIKYGVMFAKTEVRTSPAHYALVQDNREPRKCSQNSCAPPENTNTDLEKHIRRRERGDDRRSIPLWRALESIESQLTLKPGES